MAASRAQGRRNRLLRFLGVAAVALAGLTCRDRSLTGPGLPQRARLSVSPHFDVTPGMPLVRLSKVHVQIYHVPSGNVEMDSVFFFTAGEPELSLDLKVNMDVPNERFRLVLSAFDDAVPPNLVYVSDDTVNATPIGLPITATEVGFDYVGGDTIVATVAAAPRDTVLTVGDNFTFRSTTKQSDSTVIAAQVGWASRDTNVVSINLSSGVALAKAEGSNVWIVTSTLNSRFDSTRVSITQPVGSVDILPASPSVVQGRTVQLSANVKDTHGVSLPTRPVSWQSSNPAVATVGGTGVVTGLTLGSTTITATSGGVSGTTTVTVTIAPVFRVIVSAQPVTPLIVGDNFAAQARLEDDLGNVLTGRTITWSSANAAIATVDQNTGVVTGVSGGTAVISATSEGTTGSTTVTVAPVPTTIVVPDVTGVFGGTVTVTATLSSRGAPLVGRSVEFLIRGTTIGTAQTNSAGVAQITNASLGAISVGVYPAGGIATAGVFARFQGDGTILTAFSSGALTVNKATATLTLSGLVQTFDGTPKAVTVITTPPSLSTVTVIYTPSGGGSATTTPPTAAGSYDVRASLSNPNFQAADATGVLVISSSSQSISFAALSDHTFGDAPFTVSATASSGLAVIFSASGSCTVSGSTVTITAAGSCTLTASQAGNGNFAAATPVPRTFTVNPATATIVLGNLTHIYDGTPKFATFTTVPAGLTGVTLAYAQSGVPVPAPTNAGSYDVTATLSNANYVGSATGTLTITAGSQVITFPSIGLKTFGDAPFSLSATASSGLAVSYVVASGIACTVSGSTVTIVGAGDCVINAMQTGGGNFGPAPTVGQTLTVAKASAAIVLSNLTHTYDGSVQAVSVSVTPSALIGSVVVNYSQGGTPNFAPTLPGNYDVTASLNHPNYQAPTVTATLTIAKVTPLLTWTNPAPIAFGTALSATQLNATATVNGTPAPGTFTYTPPAGTVLDVGLNQTLFVTFTPSDPSIYFSSTTSVSIDVLAASQTIAFDSIPDHTFGDPSFTVNAIASSGLPVTFTSLTGGVCSVTGSTVTIVSSGGCTIQATQLGNGSFAAAPPVSRSFTVTNPAVATLTVNPASGTYGGTADLSATLADQGTPLVGKTVNFSINGVTIGSAITNASGLATYPNASIAGIAVGTSPTAIGASFAGDGTYGPQVASGPLTVDPATASMTFGALTVNYTGSPIAVVVNTVPGSLPGVSVSYDGFPTPPTALGSYAVVATLSNPNYAAPQISATFVIAQGVQTISLAPIPNHVDTDPPFQVTATATSGLPVTMTVGQNDQCTIDVNNFITVTGIGECTVRATQAGDDNWMPAPPVTQRFTISAEPVSNITVDLSSASIRKRDSVRAVAIMRDGAGNIITGRAIVWAANNGRLSLLSDSGDVAWFRADSVAVYSVNASSEGVTGSAPVTVTTNICCIVIQPQTELSFDAFGSTVDLDYLASDYGEAFVTDAAVTWTSDAPGVATVDPYSGLVTAVGDGSATITMNAEGLIRTANVTVNQRVARIDLTSSSSISLTGLLQTSQIVAAQKDRNGNIVFGRPIIYLSADNLVADVSTTGMVTARQNGSTTIELRADTVSTFIDVTVAQSAATIVLSASPDSTLNTGEQLMLEYIVLDGAGDPIAGAPISFVSADGGIASVTSGGLVTATLAPGSTPSTQFASITATSGAATPSSINITVVAPPSGNRIWVGGAPGAETDFNVAGNWNPVGLPGTNDTVKINTAQYQPVMTASATVGGLIVYPGASIVLNGNNLNTAGLVQGFGFIGGNGAIVLNGTFAGKNSVVGSMRNLIVTGQARAIGPVGLAGNLTIDGSGIFAVGNQTVNVVGDLLTVSSGTLQQDSAGGMVSVRDATFSGGNETGKLIAGTLRISRTFTEPAYSYQVFVATGTHKTVIAHSFIPQTVNVDAYYNNNQFADLEIDNPAGVTINQSATTTLIHNVVGSLRLTGASVLGGNRIRVVGPLVTASGSSLVVKRIVLQDATGTSQVSGTLTADTTSFEYGTAQVMKTGLSYKNVTLFNTLVEPDGPINVANNLYVDADGSTPTNGFKVNGQTVTIAGSFTTNNTGHLLMQNPADELIIQGDANFRGGAVTQALLAAGTLRVRGNFLVPAFGYQIFEASPAHTTVFDGTTPQSVSVDNYYSNNYFGAVVADNPAGVTFGPVYNMPVVIGTMLVKGTTPVSGQQLRIIKTLTTESGSTISIKRLFLQDTGGTMHVAGAFIPDTLSLESTTSRIKGGLGYKTVQLSNASVTLEGTTQIAANVGIYADGSTPNNGLRMNGQQAIIGGSLTLTGNGRLVMQDPSDSLVVQGNATFSSGMGAGQLTAGALDVFGNFTVPAFAYFGFVASGTHKTILSGVGAQTLSVDNYYSNNQFANLEISNPVGVSYSVVYNEFIVAGNMVVKNNATFQGTGGLWVGGDLSSSAGTTINITRVGLRSPSGTSLVNGLFTPAVTGFEYSATQLLKSGLGYRSVKLYNTSVRAEGNVSIPDSLIIDADGSQATTNGLSLNKHTVTVGSLTPRNYGRFIMNDVLDTLIVQGDFVLNGGSADIATMSAGVIRVRGNMTLPPFSYNRFRAAPEHKLIMDGTAPQTLTFDNYYDNNVIGTLEIDNPTTVAINRGYNYPLVTGPLVVKGTSTLIGTGVRALSRLVTEAGTTVSMARIILSDTTGTKYVAGSFAAETTSFQFGNGVQEVQPGLAYKWMNFYQSVGRLMGDITVSDLQVDGPCCTTNWGVNLNGHTLTTTDSLRTLGFATVTMRNAADRLIVGSSARWEGTTNDTSITAGEIRVAGTFSTSYGDRHFTSSGTNRIVLNGTSFQALDIGDYSQWLNEVEIANLSGASINNTFIRKRLFAGDSINGTITVFGAFNEVGDSVQLFGPATLTGTGSLRSRGKFSAAAGSTVDLQRLFLHDSTGTKYVAGTFTPAITSFEWANGVQEMQGGLGYQIVTFYNSPTVLTGDVAVTKLVVDAQCCSWEALGPRLNGHTLTTTDSVHTYGRGAIVMRNPADLLIVGSHARFEGYQHDTSMTAGVIRIGGDFTTSYGDRHFNASGTNRVVMNGIRNAQTVALNDYSQWVNELEIANPVGASISNVYLRKGLTAPDTVTGTLAFSGYTEAGDSIVIAGPATLSGPGQLRARRSFRAATGSNVTLARLFLHDSTGTKYVAGSFSPAVTSFEWANGVQEMQGGLGYQIVTFYNSPTVLTGDVTVTKLVIDAQCCSWESYGPRLNGHTLTTVDSVHTYGRGAIVMRDPADLLVVGTHARFEGYQHDTSMVAGEIRIKGNFTSSYGDRHFNASGTNKVLLNGFGSQQIVSLGDYSQFVNDLEIANRDGASFTNVYFRGRLTSPDSIPAPLSFTGYNEVADSLQVLGASPINGTGQLRAKKLFRTGAGSNVTVRRVFLMDSTGTEYLGGLFSPDTTSFEVPNFSGITQIVQGGLGYKWVNFYNSRGLLTGDINVTDLWVDAVCCSDRGVGPILNGHTLTASDSVRTLGDGAIRMNDPNDLLIVGTHSWFNGYQPDGSMNAGEIRVGGNFRSDYGDRHMNATGTHKTVFTGLGAPSSITISDYSNHFQNVELRNPNGMTFNAGTIDSTIRGSLLVDPSATGTMTINGSVVVGGGISVYGPLAINANATLRSYDSIAVVNATLVNGQGRLWAGRSLRTAAGSNIMNGRVLLSDSTGTAYVGGYFSADTTSFQATNGVARMQGGLNYQRMTLDNSWAKLEGNVNVTRLFVTAVCCTTFDGRGPILNGYTMTVSDSLHTDNRGGFMMQNPADQLIVGGHAWLNGYIPDSAVTAGELRVSGNFRSDYGDKHVNFRGTHTTTFNGTSAQTISLQDYSNYFRNVYVMNPAGVAFAFVGGDQTVQRISGRLAIDPITTGPISVSGNVVVTGPVGPFYGPLSIAAASRLRSFDSIAVANPVAVTGAGELWATRSLRSVAGSTIDNGRVRLSDSTGTAYIAGAFSPDTTGLDGTNGIARLQGGLSYGRMMFHNSWAKLEGNIDVSGLYVLADCCTTYDGRGPILNGHRMTVADSMHLQNRGGIMMRNDLDTLIVGGHVWMDGFIPDTSVIAGELKVAGNWRQDYGDHKVVFNGTHNLLLNGSTLQTVTFNDYSNHFQNIGIANPGGVSFSGNGGAWNDNVNRIQGRLSIDPITTGPISVSGGLNAVGPVGPIYGPVSIAVGSKLMSRDSIAVMNPVAITGLGALWAGKSLRAVAGSSFSNGAVVMSDSTGTAYVDASFAPETTYIYNAAVPARIKPGLAYKRMYFYDGNGRLDGDVSVSRLIVEATTAIPAYSGRGLDLNGYRLDVADSLRTENYGTVIMKNPADLLVVGGHAKFFGYTPDTSMTAGEIRIAGNVTVPYGDRHMNLRGTNKLVLNGTAAQTLSMDGYNTQVQNLTLSNNVGGITLVDPVAHAIGVGSRAYIYGTMENFGIWNNPAIETVTLDGGLTLRTGSTLNNQGTIRVLGAYTNQGATITGNPPAPMAASVLITAAAPTSFTPQNIDVLKSGTVTFDNQSGLLHNVTFASTTPKPTDIANWTSGTRASTIPATAGTYSFQCTNHAGMNGTVVVH